MDLTKYIAAIQDFPSEGILFRDVTPLMQDKDAYRATIDEFVEWAKSLNEEIHIVTGPEARGFLFGCPVAYNLEAGFVPVRKPGKLPRETVDEKYDLEYGSNEVSIHLDSIRPGQNVIIVDDLLATGGTVEATIHLIERLGGNVVGIAFLIELEALHGIDKLKGYNVHSLLKY
ncbi:adenine phosphoribosyltransferase [Tannockella kyphosi]|uniref:adenine phosphoribosyltransferase n=1 Tax=Tannockella kyphosi TaxID=2899121 RepID=UPI0020127269|nr:adenine phosphoribosyltransferase [Tannockella kyphosi]